MSDGHLLLLSLGLLSLGFFWVGYTLGRHLESRFWLGQVDKVFISLKAKL